MTGSIDSHRTGKTNFCTRIKERTLCEVCAWLIEQFRIGNAILNITFQYHVASALVLLAVLFLSPFLFAKDPWWSLVACSASFIAVHTLFRSYHFINCMPIIAVQAINMHEVHLAPTLPGFTQVGMIEHQHRLPPILPSLVL